MLAAAALLAFGPHLPDLRDQDRLVGSTASRTWSATPPGAAAPTPAVRRVATIVLLAGVAVCARVAWRTRASGLTPAGWAALLALVCVSWLMPWYILWALPFAALSRSRALRGATVLAALWVALIWSGLPCPPLAARARHRPEPDGRRPREPRASMDSLLTGRPRRGARAYRAPAAIGGRPILRAAMDGPLAAGTSRRRVAVSLWPPSAWSPTALARAPRPAPARRLDGRARPAARSRATVARTAARSR